MTNKYFKKTEFACNIGSVVLVVTGTVAGSVTLNPIVLGTISGVGVILKTFSEAKNYKRKIEMCKFAYTSYEKILTDIRSFMRGLEFDDERFLDNIKVVDEIIIDMCPLYENLKRNTIKCSRLNNITYFFPILLINIQRLFRLRYGYIFMWYIQHFK